MECSICLDPYTSEGIKRPVVLPRCGHTFCYECVSQLQQTQQTHHSSIVTTARHLADPNSSVHSEFRPPRSASLRVESLSACPACREPLGIDVNDSNNQQRRLCSSSNLSQRRFNHTSPNNETSSSNVIMHSDVFCVQCDRFVCQHCCSLSQQHLHLTSPTSDEKATQILESIIQELLSAQTGAQRLVERIRLYRNKHLDYFKIAITNADSILALRIEEINKQRNSVHNHFVQLKSHWEKLWDKLIELVKGQSSYIQSELDQIFSTSTQSGSGNDSLLNSEIPRQRKRLRTDLLPMDLIPLNSDQMHLLSVNDSLDVEKGFLQQIQKLSITTNLQDSTLSTSQSRSSSSLPSEFSNNRYKDEIIRVLQIVAADHLNLTECSDVNTSTLQAHHHPQHPSPILSSREPSARPHPSSQLTEHAASPSTIVSSPGTEPLQAHSSQSDTSLDVFHRHYPSSSNANICSIVHSIIQAWKLFKLIEPLLDLFSYFQLPRPKPPHHFSNALTQHSSRSHQTPQFIIQGPQVFPGVLPSPEHLLSIEYVPIVHLA